MSNSIELPPMVGYLIIAGAAIAGGLAFLFVTLRNRRIAGEYRQPPGRLAFPVMVRGGDGPTLARFAAAWNEATRCLLLHQSAWPTEKVSAVFAGGSKVQVRQAPWKNIVGQSVGGEYIAGVCIVGHTLDTLAHELGHHLSVRLTGNADDDHSEVRKRGLLAADDAYRAWLGKQTG